MPVKFTSIKAQMAGNKAIVQWGIAAQSNLREYVVQRADKRQEFMDVATVLPMLLNDYKWTDELHGDFDQNIFQ